MADSAKFQINVETVATGTGAATTKTDLQEIEAISKRQAATVAEITGAKTAEVAVDAQLTETETARGAIASTQLEANQLRAAGRVAEAEILEREVALEVRTLQLQKMLNIERAEALALARADLEAQEAINIAGATSGINLGKARQEATVLARELATGGNTMRTLGSLAGSLGPLLGVAAVGAVILFEVVKKHFEEERKIREEREKLNETIGDTERALDDSVIAARKLKEPANEWAKALKDANTALDSSVSAYKTMIEQQNQLLEAQKNLDLAKLDGKNISPSEKEKRRVEIETRYAAARKENADKIYDAEINREKEKVANQEQAAKAAAAAVGIAQEKQKVADQAAKDLQDQKAQAVQRLQKDIGEEFLEKGLQTKYMATPAGPVALDDPVADAQRKKIEQERDGQEQWLKSKQLEQDEKARKEALDKANSVAQKALEKQQAEQEAAVNAEMQGGNKIRELEGAKSTASMVFQKNQEAAAERARQSQQKDQAGAQQQLTKTNPGQAMIDAATGGMTGIKFNYGGPSGFAAERIKKAEDDIRDHGANAGNAHELESAVESLHNTIKTTMGPASAQAKTLATVVQKIKQIEQTLANHNEAIKTNRAGGS